MQTYTPPKTRIKILTSIGGKHQYIPQYKSWFFWYDFEDFSSCGIYDMTCDSIEEAQKVIVLYHARKRLEFDRTIKSVYYVNYP